MSSLSSGEETSATSNYGANTQQQQQPQQSSRRGSQSSPQRKESVPDSIPPQPSSPQYGSNRRPQSPHAAASVAQTKSSGNDSDGEPIVLTPSAPCTPSMTGQSDNRPRAVVGTTRSAAAAATEDITESSMESLNQQPRAMAPQPSRSFSGNQQSLASSIERTERPSPLPNQLLADISQFKIEGFAKRFFSTHKRGIFRKKVPLTQLVLWEKVKTWNYHLISTLIIIR